MNSTISGISFIFENLDYAVFDTEDIGCFSLCDIRTSICRSAVNAIEKIVAAGTFVAEILCNAKGSFFYPNGKEGNISGVDRLKQFDDITAVELHYSDGNSETYYVDYECSNDTSIPWNNSNQHGALLDNGNYAVVIGKGKTVLDFFKENGGKNK